MAFLVNPVLIAIPLLIGGEEFYLRWWHQHLINRIAGVLLVPVALAASFWIAIFIQIGTADRPLRISFAALGAFFLFAGWQKIWIGGLSWSSLAEGSLIFWGLALSVAAALGYSARTPV
jgi:hypothetical protein